jgi:hypothetical protein
MSRVSLSGVLGGFTHAKIIDVEDIIAQSSFGDASITFNAIGIPAGGVVTNVALHLVTPFAGGANADVFVEVGDGSDVNGFILSQNYFEGGDTGTAFCSGVYFRGTDNNAVSGGDTTYNVIKGKVYASADTIDVLITPDDEIQDLTAGKFIVLATILDPASYA